MSGGRHISKIAVSSEEGVMIVVSIVDDVNQSATALAAGAIFSVVAFTPAQILPTCFFSVLVELNDSHSHTCSLFAINPCCLSVFQASFVFLTGQNNGMLQSYNCFQAIYLFFFFFFFR